MEAGPGEFVGKAVAGDDAHIVAGHQLLGRGHGDGEGLGVQDVGGGLVVFADAQGDLVDLADAAPGGVHAVGDPVGAVGGQDEDGLGIADGIGTEVFTHGNYLQEIIV